MVRRTAEGFGYDGKNGDRHGRTEDRRRAARSTHEATGRERRLKNKTQEAEFGNVSEGDDTRVSLTISLSAAEADRIRKAAREQGVTISALIASRF